MADGTILASSGLYINTAHTLSAQFQGGAAVTFASDGSVVSGTLQSNMSLFINTAHTLSEQFQAGSVVSFNPDGSV